MWSATRSPSTVISHRANRPPDWNSASTGASPVARVYTNDAENLPSGSRCDSGTSDCVRSFPSASVHAAAPFSVLAWRFVIAAVLAAGIALDHARVGDDRLTRLGAVAVILPLLSGLISAWVNPTPAAAPALAAAPGVPAGPAPLPWPTFARHAAPPQQIRYAPLPDSVTQVDVVMTGIPPVAVPVTRA